MDIFTHKRNSSINACNEKGHLSMDRNIVWQAASSHYYSVFGIQHRKFLKPQFILYCS